MGHTIAEWASSTSVFMKKACVEVAELGTLIVMLASGAGVV